MRVRMFAALFLVIMLLKTAYAAEPPKAGEPQFGRRGRVESPLEKEQERKMEKARNEERQNDLKKDTQKLLELATELKQYVDKTNENVLSIEVIKKTEEIEKLAKSIRGKMKG